MWENWDDVQSTFSRALGAIIAPATTRQTENILTQRKKIAGNPLETEGAIKIYVVGSLCGGSCSGMLIDVAYFFRHLLSGFGDQSKVFGIFTIFDENHAAKPDAMCNIRAANCYASLLELNYYHHQDTTYSVTFPDGRKIENMRKKPFDYTLFVSPSGRTAGNQFVKPNGSFDEEGLNLMVALNLFAESAADTGGRKDEIRTNFTSHGNFGTLKPVPQGEIRTMIRYMASFGLTAVWYPKYRIATAAACLISNELCDDWLTLHIPQATTVKNAETEWNQMLKENIDTLTNPDGQASIKNRIETQLTLARQQWGNKDISSYQLSQNMEGFPTGESFREKFDQDGEYVELMKMQVSECQKAFHSAIEKTLNNQLGRIDFAGTLGLDDVRMFFETLDKEIGKTIQNCPERMPSLDLKKLDFSLMERANNSFWLKSLWLHEHAVKSHQNNLIDQYCDLITGGRESFYESVRNYYLRPILQEIRTELGFGVIPADEGGPNNRPRTIKERLDNIEGNLSNCIKEFKNEYNKAIDPPRSECVKIVANNSENRIDTDAATLNHQISQSDDGIDLLRGESMATFLVKDQADIVALMTETYRQLSLDQVQVDDVVTKAQELLDSGSLDIQNLASRSNPYQMFTPTYIPFAGSDSPNIIFGQVGTVLTNLNNSLSSQGLSFGVSTSSVDHLLFFYQEEAGFALDDLVAQGMLVDKFRQTPGEYGHSTHQNPDFYNLELYDKTQKLERWCRALGQLIPEIRQHINENAFSGVFYHTDNGYAYDYYLDGVAARLNLQDDLDGIKNLSQKQNETSYDRFFNAVQSSFDRLDRNEVTDIINSLLREVRSNKTHAALSDFYRQFLDEVYSSNIIVDGTTSDGDADLDAYFSQISSRAPEDTPYDKTEQKPLQQTQNMSSRSATDQTVDIDDYEEVTPETEEILPDIGTKDQPRTKNSSDHYEEKVNFEETIPSSENTLSSEANEDEIVWSEAEPETEPSNSTEEFAEEATIKESLEQQPQPEVVPGNVKQDKQTQPSKEFSVADVDLKPIQRRGSIRKKE